MTLEKFKQASPEQFHGAEITHCRKGHEYTVENTHVDSNGTKRCRTCKRENERARYQTDSTYRAKKLEQERTRRANETQEEREKRLEAKREWSRRRSARESLEQRENRLARKREANRNYRARKKQPRSTLIVKEE